MDFASLARGRRSIRKFLDKDVALEDVEKLINTAVTAPSGCNSQCWKFVAVKDRETILKIEEAVADRVNALLEIDRPHLPESYLKAKRKMVGFFTEAPVSIAVFMTRLDYYDPNLVSALTKQGYNHEDMMKLCAYPDLLSIGAAIQNLLLAAHEMGLGACWMNEPAFAAEEIRQILGEPEEHKFISLIPIGYPAYAPREKQLKPLSEVYRVV